MLTAEAPIPGAPAPPPGSTPADLAGVNAGAGNGSSAGAPLLTQSVNLAVISSPTTAQYTPQQIEEYQKIYQRFSSLSYYDMHVVTSQCVDSILDQSLQVDAGRWLGRRVCLTRIYDEYFAPYNRVQLFTCV